MVVRGRYPGLDERLEERSCLAGRHDLARVAPELLLLGQHLAGRRRQLRLLVVGLSDRWRTEGVGRTRLAVARGVEVPTLFVRRGRGPSGVAPNETLTRFTWTIGSERILPSDV
jgi:hypothetical protein